MKRSVQIGLILLAAATFSLTCGCAAYMHGYTEIEAMDRYMLVNKATQSFGYKRVQYICGYYSPMKGFTEAHGLPDFIYEYKNSKGRRGVIYFYVNKNAAFDFIERTWLCDSIYLVEQRPLTDYEVATYKQLCKKEGN